MQSKTISGQSLFVAGIAAVACSSIIIIFFLGLPGQSSYSPQNLTGTSPTEPIVSGEQASLPGPALPIRLKIPTINVNASVEYVGIAPDGAMDTPKSQDNVGWFQLGLPPGENGSAVIAGHYGWKDGKPSAFDNLHKLRKGDKLYIEDDKGLIIPFVVRESRRFDPNADTSDVFGSTDARSHLNLVTCEGVWDKIAKSYPTRLVVFTDKIYE